MNLIRRNSIIAAISACTMLAGAALAQRPGPGGRGAEGGGSRLDYLAGYLSLTDAQKAQAKTIFDAAATASTTARGQLTSAREALSVAVKANRAESELDRLAAAVGTIQGQLEGVGAKANAKFYALLTAEQKAKYDEQQGGRRGGSGPRAN